MKFQYEIEIEVKNDGLTRDAGRTDLTAMLKENLAKSVSDLPWVLRTDIKES